MYECDKVILRRWGNTWGMDENPGPDPRQCRWNAEHDGQCSDGCWCKVVSKESMAHTTRCTEAWSGTKPPSSYVFGEDEEGLHFCHWRQSRLHNLIAFHHRFALTLANANKTGRHCTGSFQVKKLMAGLWKLSWHAVIWTWPMKQKVMLRYYRNKIKAIPHRAHTESGHLTASRSTNWGSPC